jgi:hypothetical protein
MYSRIMIDTSVMLSLAKDYRNEPFLIDMKRLVDDSKLELVLPVVILESLRQWSEHR